MALIRGSIDLLKLDKNRIKKVILQNGNTAKYINFVLRECKANESGDSHFIVEDIKKEERLAGKLGTFLGNCKTIEFADDRPAPQQQPAPQPEAAPVARFEEDDVPF